MYEMLITYTISFDTMVDTFNEIKQSMDDCFIQLIKY